MFTIKQMNMKYKSSNKCCHFYVDSRLQFPKILIKKKIIFLLFKEKQEEANAY